MIKKLQLHEYIMSKYIKKSIIICNLVWLYSLACTRMHSLALAYNRISTQVLAKNSYVIIQVSVSERTREHVSDIPSCRAKKCAFFHHMFIFFYEGHFQK